MNNLTFYVNGVLVNSLVEWIDINISLDYDGFAVAPQVSTTNFTAVGEALKQIDLFIENYGVFEGCPFQIFVNNDNENILIFDGYIDFTNGFKIVSCDKKVFNIAQNRDLESVESKLNSATVLSLRERGYLTNSNSLNIRSVVEKIDYGLEFALLSYATFSTAFMLKDSIYEAAKAPTGGIFAIVIRIALTVAFIVATVVLLIRLIRDLIEYILSPVRTIKAIKLNTLIDKSLAYCGLTLETNLQNLDRLIYLPSLEKERDNNFLPRPQDFGYRLIECLSIVQSIYNTKASIKDGVFRLYNKHDEFWQADSEYILPDALSESKEYNTNELIANRLFSWRVDQQDGWTIKEYQGTSYEVITDLLSPSNQNNSLIKGLEEVNFNASLGKAKTSLNSLERSIRSVARALDNLVRTVTFGIANSNLAQGLENRIGCLILENRATSTSKILLAKSNGTLEANQKSFLSAKNIYKKFYEKDSFVTNAEGTQKEIYSVEKIPFCSHDFVKLLYNSNLKNNLNERGAVLNINWSVAKDYAEIDYYLYKKYVDNLKEIYVEPS